MTEHSDDLRSRLVTGFERDGRRRRFDPQAKLELVQACMQPGVSVARMALEHAVNANLLRKWIRDYERERNGAAANKAIEIRAPAFVPVVQIGEIDASATDVRRRSTRMAIAQSSDGLSPPSQLIAQLPNGVTLKLDCNEHDVALMTTLAASVVRVGEAVQPVINLMRDRLLDSDIVFADETTVQVLKEPGRAPQTKSYMWVQMNGSGPPVRLFGYAPGRGKQHGSDLWAGIRRGAVLMTDGYEPYNAIADANGLVHLGCWVHARRYFVEAEDVLPKKARGPHQPTTQFIGLIGKLYAAESHADQKPHRRARLRRRYSRAVLAQIRALLDEYLATTAPSGLLGKALNYLAGQWPKLNRYVENETWPIDNNPCENAIRPFVVGRRAWLFADTLGGAKASANLYSLVETCKANGVDAYRYLTELFKALPYARSADDYEALLPSRLSQRRDPAST